MPVKLSIITVNLNNIDGLKKTCESIINQSSTDFEWIIIDGLSSDGSLEIVKENERYIKYWISEKDEGVYSAMNKGISISEGEYLLFLNSGDILRDNYVIEKIIPLLMDQDFYIGEEKSLKGIKSLKFENRDSIFEILLKGSFPHQASFINRRVFKVIGKYNEKYKIVSDWWLMFCAFLHNASFSFLPYIISEYDVTGISSKHYDIVLYERIRLFLRLLTNPLFNIKKKFHLSFQIIKSLKTLLYLKLIKLFPH